MQNELRRYNIVSKYVGQKIEYEFEADDNGQVVLADGAVTLVQQLREEIAELKQSYDRIATWLGERVIEVGSLRAENERLSKPLSRHEEADAILQRYFITGGRQYRYTREDCTDLESLVNEWIAARKEQP